MERGGKSDDGKKGREGGRRDAGKGTGGEVFPYFIQLTHTHTHTLQLLISPTPPLPLFFFSQY